MRQGYEIQKCFLSCQGICVCVLVFFFYYYCLTTILNIFLSVNLGGAGCQTEGREDTSRPGKNQRGTGQKGRTSFCTRRLSLTGSVSPLKETF